MKKLIILMGKSAFIGLIFLSLVIFSVTFLSNDAYAAKSKKGWNSYQQIKPLNKSAKKKIVNKITSKFIKDRFFSEGELARKITLSRLEVSGADIGMSEKMFTDMVLNKLLLNPLVMIINVEVTLESKLDFSLMHYTDNLETRKKGVLLSANYYIHGHLKSYTDNDSKGRSYRHYKAELFLREIRSNRLIIHTEYIYKRKTKN